MYSEEVTICLTVYSCSFLALSSLDDSKFWSKLEIKYNIIIVQ